MIKNKLQGKIAVIAGGNRGIGLGTAKYFKENGARVITNTKNPDHLKEPEEGHSDVFDGLYQADLSNIVQVNCFFGRINEDFGQIDILFLNAGIVQFSSIDMIERAI